MSEPSCDLKLSLNQQMMTEVFERTTPDNVLFVRPSLGIVDTHTSASPKEAGSHVVNVCGGPWGISLQGIWGPEVSLQFTVSKKPRASIMQAKQKYSIQK